MTLRETYRDVFKEGLVKGCKGSTYCLFGLEPKTYQSVEIPLRILEYDVAVYQKLVEKISAQYYSNEHYLSKLPKGVKIPMVITIIIWLSADPWPSYWNLADMFDIPERLKIEVPSFPIHVIEPYGMSNEELMKFGPDLGTALVFIKNSKNDKFVKKAMDEFPTQFSRVNQLRKLKSI